MALPLGGKASSPPAPDLPASLAASSTPRDFGVSLGPMLCNRHRQLKAPCQSRDKPRYAGPRTLNCRCAADRVGKVIDLPQSFDDLRHGEARRTWVNSRSQGSRLEATVGLPVGDQGLGRDGRPLHGGRPTPDHLAQDRGLPRASRFAAGPTLHHVGETRSC